MRTSHVIPLPRHRGPRRPRQIRRARYPEPSGRPDWPAMVL